MSAETIRVGAAQLIAPPFQSDLAIEKAVRAIEDAGRDGVQLLVFPECFVGGYPYWRGSVSVKQATELAAHLYDHALTPADPRVAAISSAAQSAGVGVVLGVSDRDEAPGSCTMYNALYYFTPQHGYVGRHRKLVPTHTERAYWAGGGQEDIAVFDYGFGVIGGLVCYEHHMLAARLALAVLGEEIHCATWPGYWKTGDHIAHKIPGPGGTAGEIDAVVRDYALSTQNYVVSANAYLPQAALPDNIRDIIQYNLARGGSAVIDPNGRYLAGPTLDEETIVRADIDLLQRRLAKAYLDTVGHYARWDLFGPPLSKPSTSVQCAPPIPDPQPTGPAVQGGSDNA